MEALPSKRTPALGLDIGSSRPDSDAISAAASLPDLQKQLPKALLFTVRPTAGSHARQLVETMTGYIHQHYHRPFSLTELAAAMRMNASYLSALFSETTGITFHQYVEDMRLAKAQELLRDPVNRVCEVAAATGYASPNHFRDVFKSRFGIPPSVWRSRPTS